MGSKSKSSGGGGGNRGKVLQQDYSSFKTPEATQAALNRQKNILDRNRTSTGAFANQADDLKKAGYTLNNTRDKVMSPTGATIAGINKNNELFSGSQNVSEILRNNLNTNPNQRDSFSPEATRQDDRVSNTFNVLDQIYGLDELSKAGEEKVNRVFDYGRGVKFANDPNPADPFRLTASTPTGPQLRWPLSESNMGEAFGDMKRALSGGTAPQTISGPGIPKPRNQEGILNAYKRIPTPTNLLMKMFGGEEEEEQLNALQMQRQGYANDPYSVPTGPALPLDYLQGGFNRLQDLSPQDIIQENIPTLKESSQQESINNMNFRDPIYPAELIQQDALNRFPGNDFQIKLKPKPPVPNIYESTGASAGSPFDTGTPLPLMEEKDPNILDKFLNLFQGGSNEVSNILGTNQGNDGGSSGGGGESSEPDVPPPFDPNDPFANLDPQYLKLLEAFQSAGGGNLYSQQDIVDYFRKMKYLAYGGSVAPQSGPMSEGIGTLYNTR